MTFTVGIQVFFTLPVASFSCSLFLAFARLCGNTLFESPQVLGDGLGRMNPGVPSVVEIYLGS